MDADLLVVGGGPVGLAVACVAARRGAKCIVVERSRDWPVKKACGEGLMPPAVRWLASMGVELGETAPFAGIRYLSGNTVAEGRFPDGTGLGVHRVVLSTALAARARALGATLLPGTELQGISAASLTPGADRVRVDTSAGPLTARWLIGADGLHSRVRTLAGISTTTGPARFGLRQHFRCAAVPELVEVHWVAGAEAYVTPVGPDSVGVAILRGAEKAHYSELLARFPAVQAQLGEPLDNVRGAGPFAQHATTPWAGRVALIGDAAGYLDAITGEGLSLGWQGATVLADALLDNRPDRWPAANRAIARRHLLFTSLLLQIARRPTLRHRIVRALARSPAAFSTMLGFNTGHFGLGRAAPALLSIGGQLAIAGSAD